jgi:hypothetical protein
LDPSNDDFPAKARFVRKPYAPKHVLQAIAELFENEQNRNYVARM